MTPARLRLAALRPAILLVAALVVPAPASALMQSPEARLADSAIDSGDPVVALAAVVGLSERARWMTPEAQAELLESIAAALPHGDARTLALLLRAHALAGQGRDVSHGIARQLGFVDRWAVLGPFANEGMAAMDQPLAPELEGFDPDGSWEGRFVPVGWQLIDGVAAPGHVDLSTRIRPTDAAVLYAATDLVNVRPIRATIHLAVEGAWRLWVNGEPVAARDDDLGEGPLRDRVDVTLAGGRNRVLLKVGNDEGATGFHFRITDTVGQSIPMLGVEWPRPHGEAVRQTADWPAPSGLADRIRDHLEPPVDEDGEDESAGASPTAEQLVSAAIVLRRLQPRDPAEPWERWRERAIEAPDLDAVGRAHLAGTYSEQWRRVALLEEAAREGDPWILAAHIAAIFDQMGAERVQTGRDLLDGLLARHPTMVEARFLEARLLRLAGMYWTAWDRLHALHRDAPGLPAVERTLHEWSLDVRRDELLPELLGNAMARQPWSLTQAALLVELHLAGGDVDAARAVIEALGRQRPDDPDVLLLSASAARASGDLGAALHAVDEAARLRPGDPDIHARRGRLLVESGDRMAAAAAFDDALVRAPQAASIRRWRDRLDPGTEQFYAEWQLDDAEIRELAGRADVSEGDFTWLVDQRMVHVYRNGLATTWNQRAALVHNRVGLDSLRSTTLWYTPDAEIVEVTNVRILRPDGRVVEAHDSRDAAMGTGPSAIYYDVRSRSLTFPALELGDILVYEYRVSDIAYRNLFDDYFGDTFMVQDHAARLLVRYGLLGPAGRSFHFNDEHLRLAELTVEDRGDQRLHALVARDVPRVPRESWAPGPSELFEMISVSTFGDWDSLADWYWNLIREQLVTNSTMEREVARLVEGRETVEEQVAAIHNFVVRNIRYVALPFGIHGYKPYRTSDCLNRRFGDCKDTAALMKVMLELAGIPSEIVLIRTRDLGRVHGEPPSLSVFNHAILYVPGLDLYLDGTAGHWGSRETPALNQAASALIVHDGRGGTFLEAPLLPASANRITSEMDLDLTAVLAGTGEASGVVTSTHTGEFAAPFRRRWEADDRRRERYQEQLSRSIAGVRVIDATFGALDDIEAPATVTAHVEGGEWVRLSDTEATLRPFGPLRSAWTQRYAASAERRLPLELEYPWRIEEHRQISLPVGMEIRAGLGVAEVRSAFGVARRTVELGEAGLEATLVIELDVLRVTPEEYPDFRAFLQDADRLIDQPVRIARDGGA